MALVLERVYLTQFLGALVAHSSRENMYKNVCTKFPNVSQITRKAGTALITSG